MEDNLVALRNTVRMQTIAIGVLLAAVVWLWIGPRQGAVAEDVIYAKGLVIQDEDGKPRILLGAPVDNKNRLREDTLNGMVLLDDRGMDRVHLGKHGKLYLGGAYEERMNDGWSLFFNDAKGEERSGYGFSDDDNSVGLGMDYGGANGGEAIYLYAAPNIAFMTINADLQEAEGIRDRIVLWHETDQDLSIAKISDSKKDGRIILRARGDSDPVIEMTDGLEKKTTLSRNKNK